MPIEVHIDADANLITYTASGYVTIDEMTSAFESIFDHPGFRPGMNSLCQARGATFGDLMVAEVHHLVASLEARTRERGTGFRCAVLVRGNPEFAVSSLFEMRTQDLPFEVQVFRSSHEALDWLGVQVPEA